MDPGLDGIGAEVIQGRDTAGKLKGFIRTAAGWLLWALPVVFLALFFFYPLGSILTEGFARSEAGALAAIIETLSSSSTLKIVLFTIGQAALSTLLTLLFGLPGAYLAARFQFRGKSLLMALSGIPFVMPTLVVAASFNAFLGPRGWINLGLMELLGLDRPPLQITHTLTAILIAHVFYNTTIVLRIVSDYWAHLDPRLEQAAQTLGADRLRTWLHVTVPLLAPAVAAAALLVFIFDFTSFGVILVLGGPRFQTLEVAIYNQAIWIFDLPRAASLSIIQLALTIGLTIVYTRLSRRLSRPVSLRPQVYTQRRLTTWKRRLFAGLVIAGLLALLTLPLASLAVRSVTRLEADQGQRGEFKTGFTLDYYRELQTNRTSNLFYRPPIYAIGVSLGYAAVTVALALALGLPASWALATREKSVMSRIFDPLLMLPLGTSAVTLGLGFIIALDQPPLNLRASPLLVPLAHTLVAFPFVVRSLTPALRAIRPRLRQAAQVLGASPAEVLKAVDLPMIGRALLVAATFAFTISLGEFGATALLTRPEFPTVPVAIFRYLGQPGGVNYGQAMALSTILMLITGGGMLLIERLRVIEGSEF